MSLFLYSSLNFISKQLTGKSLRNNGNELPKTLPNLLCNIPLKPFLIFPEELPTVLFSARLKYRTPRVTIMRAA
jgi:hypothetical protein